MSTSVAIPGEPGGKIIFSAGMDGGVFLMVRIASEGPISICRVSPGFVSLKGGVNGLAWSITDLSTGGQNVVDITGVLGVFRLNLKRAAETMLVVEGEQDISKRWGALKKAVVLAFVKNVEEADIGPEFASSLRTAAQAASLAALRYAYSMACFLNPFDDVRAAVSDALAEEVLST